MVQQKDLCPVHGIPLYIPQRVITGMTWEMRTRYPDRKIYAWQLNSRNGDKQ